MSFLSPERLLLLTGVAALVLVYVALQFRGRQYAVRFTNLDLLDAVAPRRPGWRRHLAAAAFGIAVAALVIGFARPTRLEQVPRERATIMMAIDTSLSMEATDVRPNRLEAAQVAAKIFLDRLPATINLGLVSFDGSARVEVPPTLDRAQVARAIDRLQLHESTAIGEAIFTSLGAIADFARDTGGTLPPDDDGGGVGPAPEVPGRIVLMSDGTTTVGRPDSLAAEAAVEAGVQVSTIAFGTDDGTVNIEGQIVPVPVDRPALRAVAEATDGRFYEAGTGEQLGEVYEDIGSSIGYEDKPVEITTWFVGAALVALMAAAGMSLAWFSRLP
ncbi:MAG: VWA domain-containing protein [Acidimicrobiia bacterium]